MANITQGDSYSLPVSIKFDDVALNVSQVSVVEFKIGPLRKLYPGEVIYDMDSQRFLIPFTQEETFSFKDKVDYQVRVQFSSGSTYGSKIMKLDVNRALSEEVL